MSVEATDSMIAKAMSSLADPAELNHREFAGLSGVFSSHHLDRARS
jgi:hypothetical protein